MKQKLLLALLLVVSYLLSQWIEDHARLPESAQSAPENHIDSFYYQFSSLFSKIDGTPRYRISGKSLLHYDDKHSAITLPVVQTLEKQQWQITAQQGMIDETQKKIVLSNNVVLQHSHNPAEKILARELTFYPEKKLIKTDKEIKIISSGGRTLAHGMVSDLENNRITLFNRVVSQYYEH